MDWGGKVTTLGMTALKEKQVRFGIKDEDRTRHLAILGRTGSGRGELVASMALQDVARGLGAVILDANGTVAPLLIDRLSSEATRRLVYLDPADAEYPYSWNPVDDVRALPEPDRHAFLATLLTELYDLPTGTFVDEGAALLLTKPGTTAITIFLIATDSEWRKAFFGDDTVALKKFEDLIAANGDALKALDEHGKYVGKDTLVRNLIGQSTSKFTLEKLPEGQIVIVDLSKIRMFPTRMSPVVRVFVAAARAAGRRAPSPVPLYLHDCLRYLDDAGIERVFSDHHLALTVADTIIQEADKDRREKALSRVGSVISFATHPSDRSIIERAFYPYADPDELTEMDAGEMIVALTIDAVRTKAFFAKAIPLGDRVNVATQDIMVASRRSYTTPRTAVDDSFRPASKDDADDKGPKDGSFSDAFRNIFAKRAGGGGPPPVMPPTEAKKPEPVPPPAPPPAPATPPEAPPDAKPTEIPEQDLRSLLYVTPIGA
jgi:hypothetical protein